MSRHGAPHVADDGAIVLEWQSGTQAETGQMPCLLLAVLLSVDTGIVCGIAPKRINVVSPGIIDTPMVALSGEERQKHYQNVTKSHLIKRAGASGASAIIFAIENDYVTGTTIDVDGGWLTAQ